MIQTEKEDEFIIKLNQMWYMAMQTQHCRISLQLLTFARKHMSKILEEPTYMLSLGEILSFR